jgi:hypothetical protein
LAKTNTMGTQHSSIFIAKSDPSTPTDSWLCPHRRWDVHSCKWIHPAFTFIDDNYPLNIIIN